MTLFRFHEEPVQASWLDAYGHLNEAYYLVPLSNATWKLQDHFGIGVPYFEETHCAIYTVETHLRYLNEVKFGSQMQIESFIIDVDAKRIWFAHQMRVADQICATGEFMTLHYDTKAGRTARMPETVVSQLKAAIIDPRPDWVGRNLSMNK